MAVRIKTKWTLTPDTAANLRPTGGTSSIFQTYGNHDIIDWWEWSQDAGNNDLFGVAARANGGVEYYCSASSGGGTGSAGSPFSPAQLRSALDNRSLAANCIVHLAAGNYNGGLAGGGIQLSGGGGNGGWVTLLGPPAGQGVAECRISSGDRGWSTKQSASRIQYVRLHAEHETLNSAFTNYVNGGGGIQQSDSAMSAAIGQNVQAIGFQMDGSNGNPGPMVWVNCSARGWGEGFGTFQSGNAFALGCVAWECGRASPNGRSCFSFSWYNSGWNNPRGNTHLTSALVSGTIGGSNVDYYGGTHACLAYDAFQLHPSTGIGSPTHITDGNGFILPTDGNSGQGERGRFVQSCNISYRVSASTGTGFGGAEDGTDMANNTYWGTGYSAAHRVGINPFGLPINLVANRGFSGDGPPLLFQRYLANMAAFNTYGNVAINGDYDSRSLQAWGSWVQVPGRGNIRTGGWSGGVGAESAVTAGNTQVSRGTIIDNESPDPASASAHLKAGSPAIGAAWITDHPFKVDFMGRPLVDRGAGKCDAGAIQRI